MEAPTRDKAITPFDRRLAASRVAREMTVLARSHQAVTGRLLVGKKPVVVKLPARDAAHAIARMEWLYNSYQRHARVLDRRVEATPHGPLRYALIEHADGIQLQAALEAGPCGDLGAALGRHFRVQHQRARRGDGRLFAVHAGRFLAAQPSSWAASLRRRIERSACDKVPQVWSHADPSPRNILVGARGRLTFVDRHRAHDWIFVDLAVVVFAATLAPAHGHVLDFIARFLDAYGFDAWPRELRRLAVLFWAAVGVYLASPECAGGPPCWSTGPDVARRFAAPPDACDAAGLIRRLG